MATTVTWKGQEVRISMGDKAVSGKDASITKKRRRWNHGGLTAKVACATPLISSLPGVSSLLAESDSVTDLSDIGDANYYDNIRPDRHQICCRYVRDLQ